MLVFLTPTDLKVYLIYWLFRNMNQDSNID